MHLIRTPNAYVHTKKPPNFDFPDLRVSIWETAYSYWRYMDEFRESLSSKEGDRKWEARIIIQLPM